MTDKSISFQVDGELDENEIDMIASKLERELSCLKHALKNVKKQEQKLMSEIRADGVVDNA